jgi:hypothetical protein
MEKKILYFGYGANRDPKMMEWITGNKSLVGRPGVLREYSLCIQRLDQVPDTLVPSAPVPISPRKILEGNWPQTFTSYIIKKDSEGEVAGTIWELTEEERALVADWELIEFGWYKYINARAETEDGQQVSVQTEGLRDVQEVDRIVDGRNYETWLNPPEDFERIAARSRLEYFERQKVLEAARISSQNKEL